MLNPLSTNSIKLQLPNTTGHKLDARLDIPSDIEPLAYTIMSHCFTCTKDTLTTSRISRGLAQRGVAVLRFDFTGLGKSEGKFEDSNFSSMIDDILSASNYLQQQYKSPKTLIGHSMGGTAALVAALQVETCESVITIASPSQPQHVLHHFGPAIKQLEAGQNSHILVAGEQYAIKPQFISDLEQYDLMQTLQHFNKRLLCIRAGKDELVADEDADEIIQYTSAEHKLLHLEQADHLFRDRDITNTMINEILQWIISS